MKTIHKKVLELQDAQVLALPKGAKVLTAQYQQGIEYLSGGYGQATRQVPYNNLCIWYECDPEQELENRAFVIIGTGNPMPDTHKLSYIATVQDGPLVWHVFEIIP